LEVNREEYPLGLCPYRSAHRLVWSAHGSVLAFEGEEWSMKVHTFIDVLGAIVTVALVTTIVAHPNTASDITAAGNAFSNSLRAAQGAI
jgi:hypothetical protein